MDKRRIGTLISGVGDKAKGFIDKSKDIAVQTIDQNGDGKLDLTDVSTLAASVGSTVKKGTESLKDWNDEKNRENEKKKLNPIFSDFLYSDNEALRFIYVGERDKKHADSELCTGSIGFLVEQKDMKFATLFKDSLPGMAYEFYPDINQGFYMVDPCNRTRYIGLEQYVEHIKKVCITELQEVARDLGAKHFSVSYREENTTSSEKSVKTRAHLNTSDVDAKKTVTSQANSTMKIACEMTCGGHDPKRPELHYLKNNPEVENLIKMRMNLSSPLYQHKVSIKLNNSFGFTKDYAEKIDSTIKKMKYSENVNVATKLNSGMQRELEYEVDF